MSGILEQILAELQVIKATLAGATSVQPAAPITPYQAPATTNGAGTPTPTPAPADPFGLGAPTPAPAPAGITEAHVMGLIEPHLENVAIKTALQGVLQQMGIARLPEARPDQYNDLYARFQAVIAQFAVPPATAPSGII